MYVFDGFPIPVSAIRKYIIVLKLVSHYVGVIDKRLLKMKKVISHANFNMQQLYDTPSSYFKA